MAFCAQHGIRIRSQLTGQRNCHRSHQFRHYCTQFAIRHRFTRPYTPPTNDGTCRGGGVRATLFGDGYGISLSHLPHAG